MASPPLVALQIKPVPQPDIMESMGQVVNLRNAIQAGRARDQQMQTGELENQQRQLQLKMQQRELEDNQRFMEQYVKHGGDMDKVLPAVTGIVSPQFSMKIKTAHLKEQQELTALAKAKDDASRAKADALRSHSELIGSLANSLTGLPEQGPERQEMWTTMVVPRLKEAGIGEGLPEQVPSDLVLKTYGIQAMNVQQQLGARRAEEQHAAQLPGTMAESAEKQRAIASKIMKDAKTPEQWASRRASLPSLAGVTPEVLKQIPETYSPEAAQEIAGWGVKDDKYQERQTILNQARSNGLKIADADANRFLLTGQLDGLTEYQRKSLEMRRDEMADRKGREERGASGSALAAVEERKKDDLAAVERRFDAEKAKLKEAGDTSGVYDEAADKELEKRREAAKTQVLQSYQEQVRRLEQPRGRAGVAAAAATAAPPVALPATVAPAPGQQPAVPPPAAAPPAAAQPAAGAPPASAFTKGEGVVHRFRNPAGQVERWKLVNGVAQKVQ